MLVIKLTSLSACTLAMTVSALAIVGCGADGGPPPVGNTAGTSSCGDRFHVGRSAPRGAPAWIITAGGLARLKQSGLPGPLMEQFNRPRTLLLVSHGRPDALAPRATLAFD